MELKHGLLLDHDPSNPRIGHGEQKEQANDGAGAEVQEMDTKGRRRNAGREDVDGPFKTHCLN